MCRRRPGLLAFAAIARSLKKIVRQTDCTLIRALPLFFDMREVNFAKLVDAAS